MDAVDACLGKLGSQITGSLGELAEHEHLVFLEHGIGAQELDERFELVVVLRLELLQFFEKARHLAEVVERVFKNPVDVVVLRVELVDVFQHLLSNQVFVGLGFGLRFVVVPPLKLPFVDIAD